MTRTTYLCELDGRVGAAEWAAEFAWADEGLRFWPLFS